MNDERQEENRRTAGSVGGRHDHRRAGDGSRTAPQRFAGISASLLTTTSS